MNEDFETAYPEAAPYIQEAVKEHDEERVIEHYYPKIAQLGVVMGVPDIDELPFFDSGEHTAMSEDEKQAMGTALRQYWENLRTNMKPGVGDETNSEE